MSKGPSREDLDEPEGDESVAAATLPGSAEVCAASPGSSEPSAYERGVSLELADRLTTLGAMTAAIGHELNNPLTYVVGNLHHAVELLSAKKAGCAEPEVLVCVREALAGAERVASIVGDMRTLQRKPTTEVAPVNVQSALELAIRQTSNHVRHRAQLTRHYAPVATVDAEEPRLVQVFVNLLLNAAQAIPQGQTKRNEISVSLREEAERVVVLITDTGRGMPPDVLPHIFEPFYTTKPVGEGTGLGLAISRAITESFGGEIVAQSTPGAGTTMRVSLPRGRLTVNSDPTGVSSLPPGDAQPRPQGDKPRILVVDDETLVLGTVRRVLGRNYDVTTLADSREVLSTLASSEPFDLILCDLIMPDMTGMEVHTEIERRAPQLARRMLFMTGGAFTAEARTFLEQEHVRFVEKPFSPQSLSEAVRQALAKFTTRGPAWPSRPPAQAAAVPAEFAMRFPKRWDQLEMVRESCGYFARAACNDVATGQRVSLVVHELVENAIRYATNDEDRVEIDVRGNSDGFEVAVSNRSSREHSSHLFTVINELERADPKDAYLRAMRRSSRTADSQVGGLGLARIVFEAQVQLSADFSEGRMRVVARGAP